MRLKDNFFFVEETAETDGLPQFAVRLNPRHPIFSVHFPGNPIVPGVCQIQLVGELLESYLGQRLYLSQVKNIKFLAVLTPSETERFDVVIQKLAAGETSLKATALLLTADKPYAKISLIYRYDPF